MTRITVNRVYPLWDAAVLLFGEDAAQALASTANALMAAKNAGHQQGFEVGMGLIESAHERGYEEGHKEGFMDGYEMAKDVLTSDEQPDVIYLSGPVSPPTKEDLQFATDDMPNIGAPHGSVGDRQ